MAPAGDRTGAIVTDTLSFAAARPATPPQTVTNVAYVPETGHNLPGVFWNFLNQQSPVHSGVGSATSEPLFDWVYIMGYPITEAYWANITVGGKSYDALLQLFERRTLTYVPALADPWQVQMGNVGQHYYEWRYGKTGTATQQGDTNLPPLKAADGRFVGIKGADFVYEGAPVKLKGTNYWLSTAPFALTWAQWNGPRARTELKEARDLGVNSVRIGIPYDNKDTRDVIWGNFPVNGED